MAGHAISMFFLSARPCAPEVHGEAPLLRRAPPAQAGASSQSSSASPASSSSCEAATVACSWGAATAAPQEPLPQRCLSVASVVVVASALPRRRRGLSVAPSPLLLPPSSRRCSSLPPGLTGLPTVFADIFSAPKHDHRMHFVRAPSPSIPCRGAAGRTPARHPPCRPLPPVRQIWSLVRQMQDAHTIATAIASRDCGLRR